jgi:hypothetical membrane protein
MTSAVRTSTPVRLGAACWALGPAIFLSAEVVVGSAWHEPAFNWTQDNISDLGNVHCGIWDTSRPRYVCSPWHDAMNVSFVLTSVLLVLGLALTWRRLGAGPLVRSTQLLALGGAVGFGLAGAFPADVDENRHFLAGLLIFGLGNVGPVVAGWAGSGSPLRRVRALSRAAGAVGLAAVLLFFARQDLGLGMGTMERVAVFPQLLWFWVLAGVLVRRPG